MITHYSQFNVCQELIFLMSAYASSWDMGTFKIKTIVVHVIKLEVCEKLLIGLYDNLV